MVQVIESGEENVNKLLIMHQSPSKEVKKQ